jgi:serine/threonine-protein kinase
MGADDTPPDSSLALAREVDALCDRFEAALCQGTAGDLADWLPPAEPLRGAALYELVRLELEYRRRAGMPARTEDYLARYPELAADPARAARLLAAAPPTTRDSTDPECDQPLAELPTIPGYEILAELGHGGMGVVLRGRDVDLGRDVAVKVLREQHCGRPELAQRFLEEARISGQLQHPGIVPVYELGALSDRPAYFTMKLVEGQTLANLLDARKDTGEERPRFLGIFGQVCQTLAYAHARGVLHRDLKPANVMVGAFGEVQVMDWGLAKVLQANGGAAEPHDTPRHGQTQRIRREPTHEDAGACTQAGDVLGTPAYMAPEQARGELDRVDERADVFGLGAILCEILTGQPAFPGKTAEAYRKARAAQLDDAIARLDGCGAGAELVALARRCLAVEPGQRPRHAGEVAAAVTAYQNAVAERLRRAELAGAEARARAAEEHKTRAEAEARLAAERRARRVMLGLAAVLLVGMAGLGAGGLWLQQQRAARLAEQARIAAETERDVTAALQEAMARAAEAPGVPDDPRRAQGPLAAALSAARRAEAVLNAGVATEELRAQVGAVRARLEQQERNRQLALELEEIRLRQAEIEGGHFAVRAAVPRYAAALSQYGLEMATAEPGELAARLREHPLRESLLATLRDWVRLSPDKGEQARLAAVLAAAEPALTDFDRRWQAAYRALDAATLTRLADEADPARLQAATLVQLAQHLETVGALPAAIGLLRRAQPRHPADFWLNENLGMLLLDVRPSEPAVAVPYLTAALAVRPHSPGAHLNLGHALRDQGDQARALVVYREAARLDPNYAPAHYNQGVVLQAQRDMRGAEAAYREALRLDPNIPQAQNNLGVVLRARGDLPGAAAAFREAARLAPRLTPAHYNLGNILLALKDLPGAEAAYREAVRLDPRHARAHLNMGKALQDQGKLPEAVAAYREAVRLDPGRALAHYDLANCLAAQGDRPAAVAALREAVRLDPKLVKAHYNLGASLAVLRDFSGAAAAYREAIRLDPWYAKAYWNLGLALGEQGQFAAALGNLRRGHELGSRQPDWPYPSARWVREVEHLAAAEARLPDLLAGTANLAGAAEALACARVCRARQEHAAAVRFYAEAFAADPKAAEDRTAGHAYHAACCAIRAAAGQAAGARALPDRTVLQLRRQAQGWLRAFLARYATLARSNAPDAGQAVRRAMQFWQKSADLASVRTPEALEQLPDAERRDWRQFWEDVEKLLGEVTARK